MSWRDAGCRPCAVELVMGPSGRIWYWLVFLQLVAVLPWSGPEAARNMDIGSSFNKVCVFGYWRFVVCRGASSPTSRHGCEGEEREGVLRIWSSDGSGVVMLANLGEHSRQPMIWRPTMETIWWSSIPTTIAGDNPTSMWRPFIKLAAALHVLLVSSGFVPGPGEDGRSSSLQFPGGGRGPDCFLKKLFKVFSVRCRDFIVIVFSFEVRLVICTCTAVK